MLRFKPLLLGTSAVASAIVLLALIHHRGASGSGVDTRQQLAVGFLPVT